MRFLDDEGRVIGLVVPGFVCFTGRVRVGVLLNLLDRRRRPLFSRCFDVR